MTAPAGPAPSAELLTPDQVAAESPYGSEWVRVCCRDGRLHAHRPRDIPKARWLIPRAVMLAWLGGLDPADQQRACPMPGCQPAAPAPPTRIAASRGRRRP